MINATKNHTELNLGNHQTLNDVVYATLRNLILDGSFKPGERLRHDKLAAQLRVSTMPVRQALRRLETEGLVRVQPRRGAMVMPLKTDDLEEVYFLRVLLECAATRQAVPRLTRNDLGEMHSLVELMEGYIQSDDLSPLLALNRKFHLIIYTAAEKSLLNSMISTLWDRSEIYRQAYTHLPNRALEAHAEHQQILEACEQKDIETAEKMVRLNIERTASVLLSLHAETKAGQEVLQND